MENNIEKALKLVIKAHENQVRRNMDITFSYHPIAVAMNVLKIIQDDEIVITALLHDLIEDTKYDYNYIKSNFNKEIADNVLVLSEDISILDFKTRKTKFLNQIKDIKEELLVIELFDKMHNLTSDYDKYNEIGKKMYDRSTSNYDDIKWFYLSILKIFKTRISDEKLVNSFENIVDYYFK